MILYGVCITDANSYNMDGIRELMQKAEIYEDFLSDMEGLVYDDTDLLNRVENYDSCGYYGLGALLRDAIESEEGIILTIYDAAGIFLGICADVPWAFSEKLRQMSQSDFDAVLTKYIRKVTEEPLPIQLWSLPED